ncbi:MAG TPA: hypothetical protein VG649_25260 [Candidatus Angelobacter sp.]|jgi:hypothetical protein|nr:hypothetical protein [Candidatus Angelobacter sp.]
MLRLRLIDGAPDAPDTSDWDAICSTPSPDSFFSQLFREVADFSLPEAKVVSDEADDIRQVQIGWRGNPELGAEIRVVTCTETSDLPVYCTWETHGLPGMQIKWHYALDYAGQLGHVAFRHIDLECIFDDSAYQRRFTAIWRHVIGKEPRFEELTIES